VPFVCGNTGVQMTGWFRRPIERVEDFRGLKMRIPGLAGASTSGSASMCGCCRRRDLPALERGVIDAAEFVGPFLDRQLGLQRVAKTYHTTGWHETATASELIINKAAWARLPADLKAIVENAVAACNVISEAWCQKNNAEAMEDLTKNQGVSAIPLPDPVIERLRTETTAVLEEGIARDAVTRRVHESFMAYKQKFDAWSGYSEAIYHSRIRQG
jgi:TRAP-type mannitol/chloroaromatic compound transport system substrate-binding protein